MQHDSNSVRIQVTKVQDGDAFDAIEQVTDGGGVPTRYVGQQPARRWRQVAPGPQVLNQECGANGPLEGQTVEECSFRDRHLLLPFVPTAQPADAAG